MLITAIATWFAACAAIWAVSLVFRKEVGFVQIMASWGFSYIPNLFCLIAYGVLQLQLFSFASNMSDS